jgi:hypothetical protein
MTKVKRDLLTVLKNELALLEKGGYRNVSQHAWRPQFIFQDSPTCLNFDATQPPQPCSDCLLMQFVPASLRNNKIPCRQIPLNEQGETIDSFYRFGTPDELEAALRGWLRVTIERLEKGRALPLDESGLPEIHVRAKAVCGQ